MHSDHDAEYSASSRGHQVLIASAALCGATHSVRCMRGGGPPELDPHADCHSRERGNPGTLGWCLPGEWIASSAGVPTSRGLPSAPVLAGEPLVSDGRFTLWGRPPPLSPLVSATRQTHAANATGPRSSRNHGYAQVCEKKSASIVCPGDRPIACPQEQFAKGRDGPIRIPPFRGGHFPPFASSMKGVLRTALSRLLLLSFFISCHGRKAGKCPLHDRFGRATHGPFHDGEPAQTLMHPLTRLFGVPIDPPAGMA